MEKTNWKNLFVSAKSVLTKGEKSTLIEMPYKSDYKGYKFWHTTKLVRDGRRPDHVSLSYTDEFEFKIFKDAKNEKGEYVKVDEKTLTAAQMEEIFKAEDNYFRYNRAGKKDEKSAPVEEDVSLEDLPF